MAYIAYPAYAHTTTLPSGTTYSYAYSSPTNGKPTILFLHGFPSSSHDWIYQFQHFSTLGYGVLAPDLLGYGGSDSPVEAEAYKFSAMAMDLMALMNGLGIETGNKSVHVVGHDFGSYLMSYLIVKYPDLAKSCVFIAVPFVPLGQKMDLDVMKGITEKLVGFEVFGYRRFLIQEDAWKLLDEHKNSFFDLIYGPESEMISDFFPAGKLEAWLRSDRKAQAESWVTQEYKATHDKIFKDISYRGPLMWYRSRFGLHMGCEEEANEGLDIRIRVPTAFVRSKETVLSWKDFDERTGRYAEDFEVVEVNGGHGHWVQLEAAEEINGILQGFIGRAEGR